MPQAGGSVMTLRQLECFLYLSDTLNFARTAEELYISQPAVSREIKALEEEINVTLFTRTKRNVELTPAGRSLREDLAPLVSRFRMAINKAQHCQNEFNQQLTIGLVHTDSLMMLPEGINQFHLLHPHVYLSVTIQELRQLDAAFNDGSIDIVFGMRNGLHPGPDDGCELLYKGYFCIYIAQGHPLYSCRDLTPQSLNGHTLIMIDPQFLPGVVKQANEKLIEACPDSRVIHTPNLGEAQILLHAGLGIMQVPQYSIAPSAKLRSVPLEIPGLSDLESLDYYVCWHKSDQTKHASRLVSIMRELYHSDDL